MREILFRGKRKDNNEFVYGYFVKCEWKLYIEDCNNKTMNPRRLTDNDADFRCIEVIPETVGQYTGLKDKQSKKIFEGDIVRDKQGIGEVKWHENHCAFLVRVISPHTYYYLESDGQLRDTEVIGNIYDNPELLKVAK